MPRLATALGCALLLASACATRPRGEPELVPPALQAASGHHLGSILGGVAAEAALEALDTQPSAALGYRVRVEYVELDPREGLAPATGAARLFATLRGGEPIAPTGRLTYEARIASGADARRLAERLAAREFGRTRELARHSGALPVGTTGVLALAAASSLPTPADGPLVKSLRCEVSRAADASASVAFVLEDLAPAPLPDPRDTPEDAALRAPEPPRVQEEALLVGTPLDATSGPLAFVVPSPFLDGEGRTLVVFVEALGPAPDAAAVERTLAECRDALAGKQQRVRRIESAEAQRKEFESALGSLEASSNRRSAVLFLAQATGAILAGDLALVADDAALADYVKSLPRGSEQIAQVIVDGSTLGFVLERGALAFLAARSNESALDPELAGVLVRRTGEVGRSGGAIEDLLATSRTIADLQRGLVEQNRVALEDSTLAARVRGFDWLAARGLAPAGYDPYASARERRAALEAAEEVP